VAFFPTWFSRAVCCASHNSQYVLYPEHDARLAVSFAVRHRYQEICFERIPREPKTLHAHIVRAQWSAKQFVAIQVGIGRHSEHLVARNMGMARTGSGGSNGSGDYVIAFSAAPELRIRPSDAKARTVTVLSNEAMSPLFLAVIEATEEAIYNSLFRATTVTRRGHTVEALPLDKTIQIVREHGALSETPPGESHRNY